MLFLILTMILSILSISYYKQIKKYSGILYLISVIIVIFFILGIKLNFDFPIFVKKYLINIFSRGTVATALFTIVMYTGVLKNSSNVRKKLMSIRGELSIIASILTLGHNILYGMRYFVILFNDPKSLTIDKLMATILTIIMITLMIPLMVTSFKSVRRKIPYKKWKNIQRSAYVFYGLIYIHVLVLFIPKLQKGKLYDLLIYSFIFIMYYILRIYKYAKERNKRKLKFN